MHTKLGAHQQPDGSGEACVGLHHLRRLLLNDERAGSEAGDDVRREGTGQRRFSMTNKMMSGTVGT